MDDINQSERKKFQANGKVNWVRFIPWSALALVVGLALALALSFLFIEGFYYVAIMPIIAALAAGGMVLLAVRRGQCRSRFYSALLGGIVGTVAYIGYYYAGMVHQFGIANAANVPLLPFYIAARLETDVLRDTHTTKTDEQNEKPSSSGLYVNTAVFVIEYGILLLFPIGAGLRQSKRVFCENCQAWMTREITTFTPDIGPSMVEAFQNRSISNLAQLLNSPPKPSAPNTTAAIDHCANPNPLRASKCAVYCSVKQVLASGKNASTDPFEQAKGKMLAKDVQLEQPEIAAWLIRFPSLEPFASAEAKVAVEQIAVAKPAPAESLAIITPIEPPYARKVVTTKTMLMANAFLLLSFACVFGSLLLALWGGMTAFPDIKPAGGVAPGIKLLGEVMITVGGICFFPALAFTLIAPQYFATKYVRGLIVKEFKKRPSLSVDPEDDAAEFIQVVPRANWGKMRLDDATDLGFLRLDREHGCVLFEGDVERYEIPASAITSCEIETYVVGGGTAGATRYYRLVLQANCANGFWEAPISRRGDSGKFRAKKRLAWAEEMQQEIQEMRPKSA